MNEKLGIDLDVRFLNRLRGMRIKMFLSAALLSVIFFGAASLRAADAAGPTVEQQLTKMENDWADSYVRRDPSFVERITTDDFMFVGPDGSVSNKADYIKAITGDTTFTTFKINSLKVRTYGDTAVVIGNATISAKTKGEDESGDYSFTDIFVKQKGEWKAASGQATQVAKDQATE
jgi:ketosteroid isomerase-like protein